MMVAYVVTVFHVQKECYMLSSQSGVQHGYFSHKVSGQCLLKTNEAQNFQSWLYADRGATQKTHYLDFWRILTGHSD
jgi:hypothetical protein